MGSIRYPLTVVLAIHVSTVIQKLYIYLFKMSRTKPRAVTMRLANSDLKLLSRASRNIAYRPELLHQQLVQIAAFKDGKTLNSDCCRAICRFLKIKKFLRRLKLLNSLRLRCAHFASSDMALPVAFDG